MSDTETHPLPPFAPQNARLLMLGSFPPPRERWKMDFYYPNIQNDMWRIFGLVFFNDREHFVSADGKGFREAAIRDFLGDKGIAISDTAHRIRRLQGNAADKSLQILEPLEIVALLARLPRCHAILTTGELATRTLLTLLPPDAIAPAIGKPGRAVFQQRTLQLYRLPSSSRAYPLALAKKAESYRACFAAVGLIP